MDSSEGNAVRRRTWKTCKALCRLPKSLHPWSVYGLVAGAVFGGCIWWGTRSPENAKEVFTSLLSLFGVFLGATFAFELNAEKEKSAQADEQRSAFNHALFMLARQRNVMVQMFAKFEEFATAQNRAFNLPALKLPYTSGVEIDLRKIDFLISKHPDLVFRLLVEEDRFHVAMFALQQRNEFYLYEYQPTLARLGINGKTVSLDALQAALGELIYKTLIRSTNEAYDLLQLNIASNAAMQGELRELAKGMFPGEKFILFV